MLRLVLAGPSTDKIARRISMVSAADLECGTQFLHLGARRNFLLYLLGADGTRLDTFSTVGAEAYLCNFTAHKNQLQPAAASSRPSACSVEFVKPAVARAWSVLELVPLFLLQTFSLQSPPARNLTL
jgi:hypothetical protein